MPSLFFLPVLANDISSNKVTSFAYKDHWLQEETEVSHQDESQVEEKQGHGELCAADPCQELTHKGTERAKAALQPQQQEMGGEGCYKLLPHKKGQF